MKMRVLHQHCRNNTSYQTKRVDVAEVFTSRIT